MHTYSSGSMKDNLPLLKETLQFMVQQLRAEDKLCLVTFDHEVTITPHEASCHSLHCTDMITLPSAT